MNDGGIEGVDVCDLNKPNMFLNNKENAFKMVGFSVHEIL